MRVYSIGAIITFPFGLCLNIEHSLHSLYCFPKRCSLKYVFFKTRETRHTEERYKHTTIIITLVIYNCFLSHVLKILYQAGVESVYCWDLRRWFYRRGAKFHNSRNRHFCLILKITRQIICHWKALKFSE